jgi:mono/diheme cytochrome c family protein
MRTILMAFTVLALTSTAALAADAKAGQAAFDKSCKSCHGADGTASAAVAKMMKVEIKDLKSADVQGRSDADLKKIITAGTGKMKPVTAVAGADLDNVVAYVRSMKTS